VSMSDEPRERNILELILIVRFACATLDVGHPRYASFGQLSLIRSQIVKIDEICDLIFDGVPKSSVPNDSILYWMEFGMVLFK
jgi:hypothetical protein